jgi:hypothetical protein
MKKIIISETQKDEIFNNTEQNTYEVNGDADKPKEEITPEEIDYFLSIVVERLIEVEEKLAEIKDFIENDEFAKSNKIEFEKFFKDVNDFSEKVEHIYDNMPYEE